MPLIPAALLVVGLAQVAAPEAPPGPPLPDLAAVARLATPRPAVVDPAKAPAISDAEPALYVVEAAARSRQAFVLPPGPKTLRELVVEPARGTAEAWCRARVRLAWETDDPDRAGVDVPLGLLFGRTSPEADPGPSTFADTDGPAWVCRFPMPYRTAGLLEIATEQPLEGRVRLRTTRGVAADAGYFRGAAAARATPGIREAGRGTVVGLVVQPTAGDAAPEIGRLTLDGRAFGPLAKALGLDSTGPRAGGFRWLADGRLAYDRALAIDTPQVAAPGVPAFQSNRNSNGSGGAAGPWVAVFWYADRPTAAPAGGSVR